MTSTPNKTGKTIANVGSLTTNVKDPPVPILGKWVRAGIDPPFHEFRADGTYAYERQGRKFSGHWTREGDRVDFKTTLTDPALGVDRWARILGREKDILHLLVYGVRPTNWEKVERTTGDRIIGTWSHSVASYPPVTIRLRPNGHINRPAGETTWSCDGKILILLWPREDAPGGVWTDRCTLAPDFRSYSGTNQQGLNVHGTKVSDEL